jgi:hypothetical protein
LISWDTLKLQRGRLLFLVYLTVPTPLCKMEL